MEDRKGKTVLIGPGRHVPLWVWLVTGALFLCVVLFAHGLPDPRFIEQARYYNVQRLVPFLDRSKTHPPRVVVVGTSLSMCGLSFDTDLERFARENGLPELEFVRFIKLDAMLQDFTLLLNPILEAEPDVVFFESNPFLYDSKGLDEMDPRIRRFFNRDDRGDDRTKLKLFLQARLLGANVLNREDSPNADDSEKKVMAELRQRQSQSDFERFREQVEDRLRLRPFSVPQAYGEFFAALRRKHIPVVLLDLPRSRKLETEIPREIRDAVPGLIRKYQDAYGLRYLPCSRPFGDGEFSDYVHLNEAGRSAFSRWFLNQVPALARKGHAP